MVAYAYSVRFQQKLRDVLFYTRKVVPGVAVVVALL
jgi:hypothetical protein